MLREAAGAIVVLGLLAARGASAQEMRVSTRRAVPANTVVADLGAVLHGVVSVQYERAASPAVSYFVGPRVQFGPAPLLLGYTYQLLERRVGVGVGVDAGARLFLLGYAPNGLFLAFQVACWWQSQTDFWPGESNGMLLQTGLQIGYQRIFARGFVLSLGAGASLLWGGGYIGSTIATFVFPARVALGVAF